MSEQERGERRVERTADGQLVLRHPQGLRALAHPARAHAFERLFEGDALTATQLAAELGITASAMSYHLRELEKWGIVEREDGTGDGRERPWRRAGTGLTIEPSTVSRANLAVAERLLGETFERLATRLGRLPAEFADAPAALQHGSTATYSTMWVTDDELARVEEALATLQHTFPKDRTPQDHPAEAKRYELWAFLLPENTTPDAEQSARTAEP